MKRNMDVPWSYSGENGPKYWHTLCDWYAEGAAFPLQSPISLHHKEGIKATSQGIEFHYERENFTDKEFKNTIHFVPFNTQSYVLFDHVKYQLTDIHFHRPSEHVIDEHQEDLEFHFVHMNEKGENLVVAILFQLTDEKAWVSEGDGSTWDFENHSHWFDPELFFPEAKTHFYYIGSLTTPPTKGPINWFVFDTVGKMSRRFIYEFKEEVLANNNRPLQDKMNRPVYFYE